MKKILSKLQNVENAIMVVTFAVMVLTSFAQVLNRNFFHIGISWFEELARYSMIYLALLGAEAGLRDGTQLSIVAFTNILKGRVKIIVLIISKILLLVFSSVIFVTTTSLVMGQIKNGQVSPGLGVSMAIPYFALPLTFLIITLAQGVLLIQLIIKLLKNEASEEA